MWWRTDREGGPPRAPQTDSDGLPPTQTQAWSHLQKLNGAHTDCTLLINGRKQTRVCWDPRTSPGSQTTEVRANTASGPLFMCTSPSPCQAVSSVQTPTQWRKGRYQKKMTCRLAPALWGNVIAGLGSPGAFRCARLVVNPDNSMSHSCEWIRM